jgi:hypothetical protein
MKDCKVSDFAFVGALSFILINKSNTSEISTQNYLLGYMVFHSSLVQKSVLPEVLQDQNR